MSNAASNATQELTLTPQKMMSLGVLWPAEVDRICDDETNEKFLIEGFLRQGCVAITAGESSIGKSSLWTMAALSVAAGIPFLGMQTVKGPTLYFDLENPLFDGKKTRDALVQFLGLPEVPKDFLIARDTSRPLEELVSATDAKLVVIASLRSFQPDASSKNDVAGALLKDFHRIAHKYHCAILLIHHLKKPNDMSFAPDLENCQVGAWLQAMEGARALVNQTDVRIAIEAGDMNPAALRVKWNRRVYGDSPLMLLERRFDEDGEPAGYCALQGLAFLSSERREAFNKLSDDFTFKDAKAALNRSDNPTNKFLDECRQFRLIEKVSKGHYRKLHPYCKRSGVAGDEVREVAA